MMTPKTAWKEFVALRDREDPPATKRDLGRLAGRLLRGLGCIRQYRSDGLTGRGMYWLDPHGDRLSRRAGESASDALLTLKARGGADGKV